MGKESVFFMYKKINRQRKSPVIIRMAGIYLLQLTQGIKLAALHEEMKWRKTVCLIYYHIEYGRIG
ncbi:hypothetical protein HNR53_000580 [Bacillus benzoevorans]|uniref:Uncharacterized protein n=1 Tax=Bacillus benzoevorans TaxID=1456 RepID=A0A7X0HND3_9BACI|nr:hypothetical protein [Bacillus benzoevorans]